MSEQDKPKLFELDRFTFFTEVEDKKRASLSFSLREGYPRITVFTRTQSDNDGKGMINVAFDLIHFEIWLAAMNRIARTPGVVKEQAAVKHFPRDANGKITGDREITSELWYGKNEEGIIWISAVQPNHPKIVFELLLSDFHEFKNSKGETMTRAEGSAAVTTAMCRVLSHHFINTAVKFRDTSIPREKTLPYSQRNSGGQKATSAVGSTGFDDDISY